MSTPPHDRGVRAARGRVKDTAKPSYEEGLSTRSWGARPPHLVRDLVSDVALECGWGRLLFGQTFADHEALVAEVACEEAGRRDVCMYVREPHVVVSLAPQELFLDPSHTYRLWLHRHRTAHAHVPGLVIRELRDESDADAVNRLYRLNGMVTAPAATMWANQRTPTFTYLVAVDEDSGEVVGTVTGVDHRHAFNDPEDGTSLWCLAVDPQTTRPGVGRELVRMLLDRFKARGRAYLDLSVLHDNEPAIRLYEQLGFVRVPVFSVKRKNPINELLFTARPWEGLEDLNPYARIIVEEALRRGIKVRVLDAEWGEMELAHGGREVLTRESLSELTTAIAMSRCDDKRVTRRLLERAGLRVPPGRLATGDEEDHAFLEEVEELVVKPARGEQGAGITVGVRDPDALERAVAHAAATCPEVLLEQRVRGQDLRVIVIDDEVIAAAVRRPAEVVGTGRHSIGDLIERQSRRRAAATAGEARIPTDEHTRTTVEEAGHDLGDVLAKGETLQVRGTANLHTGGTIHDVTDRLHPTLADAAVRTARAIGIPVVGVDLLVEDVEGEEYVILEANERPGLANHEPQPVVERFVDLLFPQTRTPSAGRHRGD
jgi:GNAT-family acetyltransferase (TIGR03103 family)